MKKCFFLFLLFPVALYSQIITTFAGTGSSVFSGDGVPATAAGVPDPSLCQFDKYGNFFFADYSANRISKIDTLGIITTVAGNGLPGFSGDDSLATNAKLHLPIDVKLDIYGNLFIADLSNNRIRKVDAVTGIITTVAGTGTTGYSGDGFPATSADLYAPEAICLDKFDNLYIADAANYRIRKVTPAGIISTIAGVGVAGFSGDSTMADTSHVGFISGMCTGTIGNLYIADQSSSRVSKIYISGLMVIVAGNGGVPYGGDGVPATSASINPVDVALDSFNNLFITDKYNNRAYKVDAASGILYNVAGNGVEADSGDGGPATSASINQPVGEALDACGNLYIATIGTVTPSTGKRIRKVTFNPTCDPYSHVPFDSAILSVKTITSGNIRIYPNPAYHQLTITATDKITGITISNILGQTVLHKEGNSEQEEINIAALRQGMYIIKVISLSTNGAGSGEVNTTISKITKE